MAIKFRCANRDCRSALEVGDELAGRKVKCPKCKTILAGQESSGTFVLCGEVYGRKRSAGEQA